MIKRSTGRTMSVAAALTLTLALVACGSNAFGPNPEGVEFAASLGIDLANMTQTTSGLYIRDDVVGEGDPAALLDTVTFTFTGWLVNGVVFESGEITLSISNPNLTAGLSEGLLGMRIGGTRTIVIPADLGFGSQAQTGVPENAVLVYELIVSQILRAQA